MYDYTMEWVDRAIEMGLPAKSFVCFLLQILYNIGTCPDYYYSFLNLEEKEV